MVHVHTRITHAPSTHKRGGEKENDDDDHNDEDRAVGNLVVVRFYLGRYEQMSPREGTTIDQIHFNQV